MKELFDQALYYLDALWRRRWQVIGIVFMLSSLTWALVSYMPNQYTSSARIYVDTQNVLRPLLRGLTVDSNLEHQVQVMRQTLLSRPNLEAVARMTDLDIEAETPAEYERLIDNLESKITVRADRENIFAIEHTRENPQMARSVVQALTTLFVENNLGENREDIDNAQSFLGRQVEEYEQKLNAAERRLAQFKQENMEFLPGQSGLQTALQEGRNRLAELRAQLNDAREKRALLEEELAQTPEMVGAQIGIGGGPPSNLQVQILEIRGRLEDLKARYTEQHPDVVTLQRRLERMQEQLVEQMGQPGGPAAGSREGSVPNPVYADIRMELLNTRSEIQSLENDVRRVEENLAELRRRINLVPEIEAELQRLTRDHQVISSQYESLRGRLESAELTANRDRQGSDFAFRMIESPQIPRIPSGPNRPLFLIGGFLLSLAAGVGVAWLLAMVNITYGSVEHLRDDFDIPVIGAIRDVNQMDFSSGGVRWEAIKVGGSVFILLASLAALLIVESELGILSFRGPVSTFLATLFAVGSIIFLWQLRKNRRRYDLEDDTGGSGAFAGAVQAS